MKTLYIKLRRKLQTLEINSINKATNLKCKIKYYIYIILYIFQKHKLFLKEAHAYIYAYRHNLATRSIDIHRNAYLCMYTILKMIRIILQNVFTSMTQTAICSQHTLIFCQLVTPQQEKQVYISITGASLKHLILG